MSAWKMVSRKYLGIENITDADRTLAQKHWHACEASKLQPPRESVKALFALYHKYVYKYPADQACSACVQHIYH